MNWIDYRLFRQDNAKIVDVHKQIFLVSIFFFTQKNVIHFHRSGVINLKLFNLFNKMVLKKEKSTRTCFLLTDVPCSKLSASEVN